MIFVQEFVTPPLKKRQTLAKSTSYFLSGNGLGLVEKLPTGELVGGRFDARVGAYQGTVTDIRSFRQILPCYVVSALSSSLLDDEATHVYVPGMTKKGFFVTGYNSHTFATELSSKLGRDALMTNMVLHRVGRLPDSDVVGGGPLSVGIVQRFVVVRPEFSKVLYELLRTVK